MNKTITTKFKIMGFLVLVSLALTACGLPIQSDEVTAPEINQTNPQKSETPLPVNIVNEEQNIEAVVVDLSKDEETSIINEELDFLSKQTDLQENLNGLTDADIASLIFMREEEKLAHDVYLVMYDLWGLPVFQNIARSEESHTNAVKQLLHTFNIPDPADTSPPGVFVNPDLQMLYNDLVTMGERSLADALKVGGAIEEIDILDLQEALDETDNPEIQRVYQNLLRGSENHLRSFRSTLLQQTGETYIPQYMDVSVYDGILASAPARGNRNNNRRP